MTHDLQLFAGPALLGAISADADAATRRVWCETYIVDDDHLGQQLGRLLVAAAARGADARLLYDPSGSFKAASRFFRGLEARGVKVRPFGRAPFMRMLRPGVRDHARIFVIDGHAYTGGHNWADEWGAPPEGEGWQDLSVRVTGPIVEDFATLFCARWEDARRGPKSDYDTGTRHDDVRLLGEGPNDRELVAEAHEEAFRRARHRIWLAHAYYLPRRQFHAELAAAAARGVDVRVIVPGKSDLPMVRRASRASYPRWRRDGLRLFEYQPTVFHSKYTLVDDDWATVGSYNALPSAGLYSMESALLVRAPAFIAALATQYERDLLDSVPVTPVEPSVVALAPRVPVADRILDATCLFLLRLFTLFR